MKLKLLLLLAVGVTAQITSAQTITIDEYINTYKEVAIQEMIRTGVPAAIKLAQGIVETENGNSKLVKKSNNHFGIKCKETWTGPSVSHDDDAPGECFRKYGSAAESYVDHSNFLRTRKHYAFLFTLDPADYKAWAYGLKKAGYATNPRYPEMLIKYIETYKLNEYSLIALGRKNAPAAEAVSTTAVAAEVPAVPATLPPAAAAKSEPVQKSTNDVAQSLPPAEPVVLTKALVNTDAPVMEKKQAAAVANQPNVAPAAAPAVQYPQGEFKINETRVVYVAKGTSFLSLAQQYNVPLKYLFDFNDLPEQELLAKDQLVYLQRKRRTGAREFHVVQTGESLYDIAQQQGIRLEALLQYNLLKIGQQPAAGEKLNLQTQATAAPRLSTSVAAVQQETQVTETVTADETSLIVHVVQAKETLYSISKRYQVTAEDIRKWNQLSSTDLREGMELIINK